MLIKQHFGYFFLSKSPKFLRYRTTIKQSIFPKTVKQNEGINHSQKYDSTYILIVTQNHYK